MARHVWTTRAMIAVIFVGASAATAKDCSECHKLHLTGSDFAEWRSNTGDWQNAGDVQLNPENDKLLITRSGSGAFINGPMGKTVNLFSKREFADLRAHLEFVVAKDSNSGVYFQGRYEVQIYDSWQKPSEYPGIECAGIYQRWDEKRNPKGYEGHSPRVNVSRPPGKWQTLDVVFRAPRFDQAGHKIANARFEKIVHNGVLVHRDVELTGPTRSSAYNDEKPTGPLMLQGDHGPVGYCNIWVSPAGTPPFFAFDNAAQDAKHKTIQEQAQMLKELGYAGIGPHYTGPGPLAQTLKELDKDNLQAFAFYTGINVDPGARPFEPSLAEGMKVLAGRNTIFWVFAQSKQYKPSDPAGDARAVEILTELADKAAEQKVRIALYPHYGLWLETIEDALRLAEKVNRPNLGVTFNLCHWLRVNPSQDLKAVLEKAMPRLFVVNINGADSDGKDWKTLIQTLDRGTFDTKGFLEILRDAGYTGPIGFQGYGIGGDAYDNLKRTMTAWEKVNKVFWGDVKVFGAPRKY